MPWPLDNNSDTAVFGLLEQERVRQNTGLQLIASENFTSPDVMRATGSVFTNKYSEGYPGNGITAAMQLSTTLKRSQLSELSSCSAQSTPTCSHTQVPARTWRSI